MYQNFYNLKENPFNLTPDPKFHYVNDSTREALAALLYGIESRKGIIALVGDAGTGKTTLLKRVLETVEKDTRMVFVFNPGVSFDELLEFICLDLGIRIDNSRRLHLLDRLNRYLLEQLTSGHNVVVMIDEAQTLNDETLEQLRLLTNLETSKEKTLQIVLSGQTELEEKLRKPSMRQLRQRIGARATLRPMAKNEIGPYIETRLSSAGAADPRMFGPAALRRIWVASQGIARVINVICDSALVIGFAKSEPNPSTATVKEAIRDLTGEGRVPGVSERLRAWLGRPVFRYLLATTAALVVAAPLTLLLLQRASMLEPTSSKEFRMSRHGAQRLQGDSRGIVPDVVKRSNAVGEGGELATTFEVPVQRLAKVVTQPRPVQPGLPEPVLQLDGAAHSGSASAVAASPPALRDAGVDTTIEDAIRRAEILARSAAARLYQESVPAVPAVTETVVLAERKVEAERKIAAQQKVEAERKIAAQQKAEAERKIAAQRKVEAERKIAAQRKAEAERKIAAQRKVEAERKIAAQRKAEAERKIAAQAALKTSPGIFGWTPGYPPVGRLVALRGGDTISKVATRYYPDAGSVTVDALLALSPTLRNLGPVDVGDLMLLPFLTAQEMVTSGFDGSYRVLLARAPRRDQTGEAADWARAAVPKFSLRWESPPTPGQSYSLYAVGFMSRNDALAAADYVLFKLAELQAGRPGRRGSSFSRARLLVAPGASDR